MCLYYWIDLCVVHSQPGRLAGAAHPLIYNAGVLMLAQRGQNSLGMNANCENIADLPFMFESYSTRGVRKVTTGITGLWQPSVHSDVAF